MDIAQGVEPTAETVWTPELIERTKAELDRGWAILSSRKWVPGRGWVAVTTTAAGRAA